MACRLAVPIALGIASAAARIAAAAMCNLHVPLRILTCIAILTASLNAHEIADNIGTRCPANGTGRKG
jgi:hypothetical protein